VTLPSGQKFIHISPTSTVVTIKKNFRGDLFGDVMVFMESSGLLLHRLEERCDLAQGVCIVADQGMTAGWKEDDPVF